MLQSPIKAAKWRGRIFACFLLDGFCVSRGSDSADTGSRLVCFHCSLHASTWFSSSHLIFEAEITVCVKLLEKEKLLVDMALTGASQHRQIHGNSTGWACWVWTQGAVALVYGKMLLPRSGFLWLLNLKVLWPNNVISLWTIQIIEKTFHHSKMQCFVALISHDHMTCIKPQKQCSHRWKHCYFIFSFNFGNLWNDSQLLGWRSLILLQDPYKLLI